MANLILPASEYGFHFHDVTDGPTGGSLGYPTPELVGGIAMRNPMLGAYPNDEIESVMPGSDIDVLGAYPNDEIESVMPDGDVDVLGKASPTGVREIAASKNQNTQAVAQQVFINCQIAIEHAHQSVDAISQRLQSGTPMTQQRAQQAQDLLETTFAAMAQCQQAANSLAKAMQSGPLMSMQSFNGKIAGLHTCISNINTHVTQNDLWLAGKNPYAAPTAHGNYSMLSRLAGFHGVHGEDEEYGDADVDLCGLDVLGAPPDKNKKKFKGSALLDKVTKPDKPASKNKAAKLHPIHAAPSAYKAGVRALQAGNRALRTAHGKPHRTVVHGDYGAGSVLIGASPHGPVITKKLTAKQKAAVDKYNAAVKKAQHAGVAAAASGKAARAAGQKALNEVKNSSAAVSAMLNRRQTMMHGTVVGFPNWDEIRGVFYSVGDDAPKPDPFNPGYLTDGTPDPNAKDTGGDPNKNDDTPPPPPPDIPTIPPYPIATPVLTMPADGIPYDGTKGWPDGAFGSWNLFFTGAQFGSGDGFIYGTNEKGWTAVRNLNYVSENPSPSNGYGTSYNWGPLIGNPKTDFKNLRWAMDKSVWFWFIEQAPDWLPAVAEMKYKAAKLATSEANAEKATKDADDKARAKEKADSDAETERQNTANALAESQATSEANVSETKRQDERQQQEFDAQKSQLDQATQQAQLDAQYQAAQFEQQKAQAEQDAQMQQIQLDYLKAHPELLAPQGQGQGAADQAESPAGFPQGYTPFADDDVPPGLPAAGDVPYPVDVEGIFDRADLAGQMLPAFSDID